jgi:hypothetical protein
MYHAYGIDENPGTTSPVITLMSDSLSVKIQLCTGEFNVKKEVILAKSLNSKRVLLAQCRCCFIVAWSWNIFSPSGLFLCALDTVYEH